MQGVLTRSRTSFQEEYLFTLSTAKSLTKRIITLRQKDSTSEEMEYLKLALNEYFNTVLLSHQDIYEHAVNFTSSLWLVTDKDVFQNSSNQGNSSKGDETPARRMFHTFIRAAFNKLLLIPSETAVHFVSKMATALAFHRCLILYGPQKSGKTTVARTLATSLNDLFADVDRSNPNLPQFQQPLPNKTSFVLRKRLIPMALSLNQLYGSSHDGKYSEPLIKYLASDNSICPLPTHNYTFKINESEELPPFLAAFMTHRQRIWIEMDGTLGADWMEHILGLATPTASSSLTSGSAQISLMDNESFLVAPNVNFIFETIDLSQASPTLILNSSVIYVNDAPPHLNLEYEPKSSSAKLQPLYKSYIMGTISRLRLQPSLPSLVSDLLQKHLIDSPLVDRLIEVQSHGSLYARLSPLHSCQNVIALMQSFLTSRSGIKHDLLTNETTSNNNEEPLKRVKLQLELVVVWSLCWGMGSTASEQTKCILSSVIQKEFSHLHETWHSCSSDLGLFSMVLDLSIPCFRDCKTVLCGPSPNREITPFSIYVPRVDSTLVQLTSRQVLRSGVPLLVFGPSDAGSTSCLVDFLQRTSVFTSEGLTTLDKKSESPQKSTEASRITNIRLTTTMIISSLAGKLKLKRQEKKVGNSASNARNPTDKLPISARMSDPDTEHTISLFESGAFLSTFVRFNESSTITNICETVERVFQRERKRVFEPPPGKAMVLVLDDMHLPSRNQVRMGFMPV
ncbi:hypothetical protein AC1031_007139 [Aphanomyces cochlioides]|nr:hypothetical protein AC1031_007139 [Aphanomyces cochlioides]